MSSSSSSSASPSSTPLHQQPRLQQEQQQPVYLDGALLLGRRLVLEWERVNGCPNVQDHIGPAALRSTANAVEQILKLHQVLLESVLTTTSSPVQVSMVPVTLGSLELDAEEARMVVHEALRHTITRLGDLLNDIEDESKQATAHDIVEDVKRAQMLMFRLLGRVPI
ncbi:hypothetical protein JX265_010528 [Neoarthrinium moseri]|uniref:Uncharacterized protein n=1 Tax=Neoarthrinium moseri TaxID=1658444 RepID=A0A9P9WDZ3_9PEZI|nr:uncharacterized protein JN550_012391 [Neoarthrinium moseri]KAI1846150.1 hypothetical protein JX266_007675 [Neoarthrinium moseri]KAI1858829.1 hypothetical protein JN550_012391 [Neoarthrinium moseri]KAI1859051.1 hypothetical protein JX265_010528 [Neoarthrinium moseri]